MAQLIESMSVFVLRKYRVQSLIKTLKTVHKGSFYSISHTLFHLLNWSIELH